MPGTWSVEISPFGPTADDAVQAVHMVHVYHPIWDHWGRFLVWGWGSDNPYGTPLCYLWTPPRDGETGNGTFQLIPNTRTNLFCCGHCHLEDGRVFTAGGQFRFNEPGQPAPKNTDIFTPTGAGGFWSEGPDMTYGRWYPTCTRQPDGTVLITSGKEKHDTRTGGTPGSRRDVGATPTRSWRGACWRRRRRRG